MNRIITCLLLYIGTYAATLGQLHLTAGDRCTCPFGPTNFFLLGGGPLPYQPVFGEVLIRLYETSLSPGAVLRYEMFENSATEQPICGGVITHTNSNPSAAACDVDNAWGDLQGTVRLTMVSGSATLHSVSLQVGRFADGRYQRWQGGLPLPSIAIDPRLSITTVSNGQVQVTWPTNDAAYVLEQARILPTASWSPVTNGVIGVGAQFGVIVPSGQTQTVFRLRKP